MKTGKINQKGSILIGVIITIIVMGLLAAAMTKMFSSSAVGTTTPSLSNSAYYTAESAYRYVLYKFLNPDTGDDPFEDTLQDDINGKTLVLDGNKRAGVVLEAFWFVADQTQSTQTLNVRTPVTFPGEYTSLIGGTGYLTIVGNTNNPIRYTNVTAPTPQTFIFTLANTVTVTDGDIIYPAFLNTTMTGTIDEGVNIPIVGGGNLDAFPQKNGAFSLTTNGSGAYILLYERLDTINNQLINVRSAAHLSALPSGGLQNYGGIDHIALLQNIRMTVTGQAGDSSSSFYAERSIEYYQPMIKGSLVTKQEYTDDFDSLDNWLIGGNDEVGDHAIVQVDDAGVLSANGDNAMTVTDTYAYGTSGITAAYYGKGVQESLLQYEPQGLDRFKDAWDQSDEKLSYEVQCKVSFSDHSDNANNNPQGTYMPGIVFRSRDFGSGSSVRREYYGLSFVRALFSKDGNGDPNVTNPDIDDIPDEYLFENNSQNPAISQSVADDVCVDDYTPDQWDDTPPMSGVPYMMFWQQAFDFDQYDGLWVRNNDLYVDWLSYVPLCQLTEVNIYYYPADQYGIDSTPCAPCGACTPKTWIARSGGGGGYHNLNWFPPGCINRTIIRSWWSWFRRYREYRCDTYDCTGIYYDADCCGPQISYPEGWYLGPIPGDHRTPVIYTAYKIENHAEYGEILQHTPKNINGVDYEIIGDVDNLTYLIRDPATFDVNAAYRGDPIEDAAFIFPNNSANFQQEHNYRVYLKPWVTVMARIIELKGDFFNEDADNGTTCGYSAEERVNIIQAWFGEPSTYPRGEIRWPDEDPTSFSEMIWPDRAYTSKVDQFTHGSGWSASEQYRRLCSRGDDEYNDNPNDLNSKRSPYVYSNQLTSERYGDTGYSPAELGLHTFGIDASGGNDGTGPKDEVYFDDFSVRIFQYGDATGLLPGVQGE